MLIRMIETRRGWNDGFTCRQYAKHSFLKIGEDIGHTLACQFINSGYATEVDEDVINKLIASPYLNQPIA